MSVEAKVKAANLRKLGDDLENAAKNGLEKAKAPLESISVGFPGFSVLGLSLYFAHEVFINQSKENIDNAKDAMTDFHKALVATANTWSESDDSSAATITY
ncbi:hypothetical protein AGRA3207_005187 [Actinomadura graeca]|uniref:Excreted virulence factor EspC, type VII ESX diderm n=1 Tax=Actinomadura graeca TaxID=2750812 RepID=A0ABX8QZ63_9ACTN|nr:hypothetical protein [Actinomadura graeca]QXJ23953.1 hypothetical protein AGRA3207_005187 [Actinomadura graeca]